MTENGRNFGSASKIGHHKPAILNSKFELQKSGSTEAERSMEKYAGTALYKMDIIMEKINSKI
jgi:hypothetical protein